MRRETPEEDVSMKRIIITATACASLAAIACSDNASTNAPASDLAVTMASAFSAAPAGYSNLSSSYVGDQGASFNPEFGRADNRGRGGPFHFAGRGIGPGFGLGFMGGGLFGGFIGNGFVRAIFASANKSCAFASATGVITCEPSTHGGLTVTRAYQFQTADGTSQEKFDSTTSSVTTNISVKGTSTRRDSSSSTIDLASSQTVSGLGRGSTGLTMNSASAGTESATGTSREGAFTAQRTAGDTVTGVVIPFPSASKRLPYPTAGMIIRSMSGTVTIDGQSPTTSTRREVITYDGSNTAKVMITLDGETQNCTLPLPFGRLTCS
jgi:hypothetical protein